MKGLNIALKCMIEKIQQIDEQILTLVSQDKMNQCKALQLQENSNSIMMLLFKKWVVTDLTAQSFLREHNGFNFMLKRLFQDYDKKQGKHMRGVGDSGQIQSKITLEVSSDETDSAADDDEAELADGENAQARKKRARKTKRKAPDQLLDSKKAPLPLLTKQTGIQI